MLRFFRRYSSVFFLVVCFSYVPLGNAGTHVAVSSPEQSERAEEGLWLVEEKDGIFQIAPCSNDKHALCGWLVGMDYTEEEPEKDVWGRSECGLQIVSDMTFIGNGKWDGRILDPRSGHTYGARIWLTKNGHLKLLGYLGVPLLGQTQTWTRYKGPPIGNKCRMTR